MPSTPPAPSPPPAKTEIESELKYAMLIQGFGRVVLESVRKEHWERISKLMPPSLAMQATPKYPHKDRKYFVMFESEESVTRALNFLKADETRIFWEDARYGTTRKVYVKRHKEIADRDISSFRRHFYVALERFFMNRDDFKTKKIELSTVRGVLTAEMNNELYGLFTFSREFLKGTTVVTVDEHTCEHLKIPVSALEAVIQEARDEYEAQQQKQQSGTRAS